MRIDPRESFSQVEMYEYEAMLDAQEEYERQMAAAAEAEDEAEQAFHLDMVW